jgi:hypothetical protein
LHAKCYLFYSGGGFERLNESRDDTIGTTVGVEDAMACGGKQKVEAMAQCLPRYPVPAFFPA